MTRPCLLDVWAAHEVELRRFLRRHSPSASDAEDVLQDVFLKALLQEERFCALHNPRAWLFEVARNALADQGRRTRPVVSLPEDLAAPEFDLSEVDRLAGCMPRVLSELSSEDREAIELCDIGGMTQRAFAELKGLSLPGAKSRVQRARQRLRSQLLCACKVVLDEHQHVCCFVPRPPLD